MAHSRCDFYNGDERCANKIYREVIYSKSGEKMKSGMQTWYVYNNKEDLLAHFGGKKVKRKTERKFSKHIFPRDTVFSHLCRKHFKQEKSKLLGWC